MLDNQQEGTPLAWQALLQIFLVTMFYQRENLRTKKPAGYKGENLNNKQPRAYTWQNNDNVSYQVLKHY